jgi:hypothetical protein
MTDLEYQLLDEMYFVTDLERLLKGETKVNRTELIALLQAVLKKGWIKCMLKQTDEEISLTNEQFSNQIDNLWLLISKEGLKAHNSVS